MRSRLTAACLLAAALLIASQSAPAQDAWTFRCPEAGTTVAFRPGLTLRYEGATDDPRMCRVAGQRTPWVLGVAGNEDPVGRALLETMGDAFFPASPGAVARRGPYPGGSGISGQAELTFIGFETLRVPAGSFEAVHLTLRFQRTAERVQHHRAWLDRTTGVLLRLEIDDTRDNSRIEAAATSVTRP